MEIVSAPNGTKFIKPDFECVLYEEVGEVVFGRIGAAGTSWNIDGTSSVITVAGEYDLTPAPQPWYDNITTPILCNVEDKKYPFFIIRYDSTGAWPLKTSNGDQFSINECTPLTSDEVQQYIINN